MIKKCGIKHKKDVEGIWNYVYFSFAQGRAKAFNLDGSCEFEVKHPYITEYVEFFIGKSTLPLFNGKIAKI